MMKNKKYRTRTFLTMVVLSAMFLIGSTTAIAMTNQPLKMTDQSLNLPAQQEAALTAVVNGNILDSTVTVATQTYPGHKIAIQTPKTTGVDIGTKESVANIIATKGPEKNGQLRQSQILNEEKSLRAGQSQKEEMTTRTAMEKVGQEKKTAMTSQKGIVAASYRMEVQVEVKV